MSEIQANKLSPASGTALQIGDASDVITIPSGATITNSGTATGFGVAGTESFFVTKSSSDDQTLSNNTAAKITFDTEGVDVGNNFASNKYIANNHRCTGSSMRIVLRGGVAISCHQFI